MSNFDSQPDEINDPKNPLFLHREWGDASPEGSDMSAPKGADPQSPQSPPQLFEIPAVKPHPGQPGSEAYNPFVGRY